MTEIDVLKQQMRGFGFKSAIWVRVSMTRLFAYLSRALAARAGGFGHASGDSVGDSESADLLNLLDIPGWIPIRTGLPRLAALGC